MKFNHQVVPNPMFTEHTMFASEREFAQKVIEGGTIKVLVSNNTKTTLNISLYLEGYRYGVNMDICEDLKYHSPKPEWNYLTGNQVQHHFLKVLKAQKFEAVQQHIEAVINKYFPVFASELEELNVEYHNTPTLQSLQN